MQTFISDIIPKIQRFSHQLDDLTILTNQHWVVIDDIDQSKNVYIFRKNNELLVSSSGEVEKGRWEYLGNNSLIDRRNKSYLFKHGFFDENVLALKIDGRNEYAFLINENKYDGELNSFARVADFLSKTYINPSAEKLITSQYNLTTEESSNTRNLKIDSTTNQEVLKNSTDSFIDVWIMIIFSITILLYIMYFNILNSTWYK
ncbi:MAG: hypothetical protein SH848_11875 [Saprospiraceae bacterium]|nr:hypothetical protein [Saprospiraceae bacterium]MDZ4704623.1 hypothetical protein [Saprospiraceae bacterium]